MNNIIKKCNKLIGFTRVVAGNKNSHVLLKGFVLPIIDYCSPVWNVHKKCNVDKLEQVQRRATRMILCQRRGEQSYEDRLKTLNSLLLKLEGNISPFHLLVHVYLMLVLFSFAGGI